MVTRNANSPFPVIVLDRRIVNEPFIVLLGYIVLAIVISPVKHSSLQVGLAIILGLFGSGSSLVAALFPRPHDLDFTERVALSSCLSMTVGGLLGFALARSPIGLRLWPFLITTGVYNAVCFFITWYRRRNLSEDERMIRFDSGILVVLWRKNSSKVNRLVTAILSVSLLLGVYVFVRHLRTPAVDPPMTEFYLLGQGGQTETYPRTCRAGGTLAITYGIVNRENKAASYQVKVYIASEEVGKSQSIELDASATQTSQIIFQVLDTLSGPTRVDYVLYRDEIPYRFLHLWLYVNNP
jgi:uncharacterized membrane protein